MIFFFAYKNELNLPCMFLIWQYLILSLLNQVFMICFYYFAAAVTM